MTEVGIERPRIAITELQEFAMLKDSHGRNAGVRIPNPATVSEAMYLTLIIAECIRLGDLVEMITHSATVNHGGGLRKRRERTWGTPVHYAHVMGVALAGGTPLGVELTCGAFDTHKTFGHIEPASGVPMIDATAVESESGELFLLLVNRTDSPVETTLKVGGAAGPAEILTLSGETCFDENTFEDPQRIVPQPSTADVADGVLTVTLPSFSVSRVTVQGS